VKTVTFHDLIGKTGLFSDGDWIESKDQDQNGDVRLIQLADIGVGKYTNKSSRFMTSEKAAELKCTLLKQGDILIARMPDPIGRACIFPGDKKPCVTVVDICIVRPDPKIVDSNWLVHFINSNKFQRQISSWITGTTRQRVSRGNLSNVEIPLPPLEEQKRIAAILDKADAIRRKRQQAIDLTDQLLRSVFLDMFGDPVTNPKGWKTEKLGTLVTTLSGGTPPKENKSYWSGEFPWVSPKDMKVNIIKDSQDHISETVFRNTNQKKISPNSILIVVRGMILVHTVPIGITSRDVAINQDIKALVPKHKLWPVFLMYCLKSMHSYLLGKVSTAAHGTKRIEMDELLNVDIILPSIDMQQQFSFVVEKHQELIERLKNSNTGCQSLLDSVTQRAFSGELTNQTEAA
jgi:type I restriction enzyme, S subunit